MHAENIDSRGMSRLQKLRESERKVSDNTPTCLGQGETWHADLQKLCKIAPGKRLFDGLQRLPHVERQSCKVAYHAKAHAAHNLFTEFYQGRDTVHEGDCHVGSSGTSSNATNSGSITAIRTRHTQNLGGTQLRSTRDAKSHAARA